MRLSSVALLLLSECADLQVHLRYLFPSLVPPQRSLKMAWSEELKILIPEQWSALCSIDKLNSLGHYLLVSLKMGRQSTGMEHFWYWNRTFEQFLIPIHAPPIQINTA